jgi:hypothetical protein
MCANASNSDKHWQKHMLQQARVFSESQAGETRTLLMTYTHFADD